MLASGKSPNTVRHAHLRLSKSLNDAVKRQLIHLNPCQVISPPKADRRELHPPDAEAINQLLSAARHSEYYEAIHLAFHTGMRRGEVLATRWRDTDLEMATISISRSVYQMKGGNSDYQPTKTGKGQRLVSLTPSSVLVLQNLRVQQQADALIFGYSVSPDTLVFRHRDGRPILTDSLSHAFNRLCVKAGLGSYRFHDTRHAHATQMLRQGIHPKIVQERLGHAKVGTTLDIYSHVTPGLQEAAALRFEEGLNSAMHEEAIVQGK
jgi:integrase